ncbi:ankyrin repeat-containing domain protein [Mycena latifolia]|nr:ankyrin repeat-containing domain protein [Mycena latifolia]
MAEILGLIASILQFIDTVAKARSSVVGFRDAPKDQEKLLLEIQNLRPLMTELDLRIKSDRPVGLPSGLRHLDEQLAPLEEMMQRLKAKLDPGGISKVSSRLTWALWGKEDVHEGLKMIERFKSSLSVWLGMDNWDSTRDITTFLQNIVEDTRTNHADVLSTVKDATEEQRIDHNYISKTIRDVARNQERQHTSSQRTEIIEWFSPLNFFPRQADIFSTRQPGTGEWLLNEQQFQAWKSDQGKILWCPGKPGAGKTVLVSIVIDHLRAAQTCENIGVAVIYLNHKDTETQSPPNLMASLWRQLVWQKSISSTVHQLYAKHCELHTRPTPDEIHTDLCSTISEYSKVFILVDALDEYPENQRGVLLRNLSNLGPNVSLMLTSRPHIDIGGFANPDPLEIRASEDDIRQYVHAQVALSPRLNDHIKKRPDLLTEIETKVVSGSEGMFLLAKLRVDSLAMRLTIKAVREALNSMPRSLDRAYDEIMARIKSQDEDRARVARSTLLWISNAQRPLHASELIEALAVEHETTEMDPDNLLDMATILSVCAGLVMVEPNSEFVRLIHFTTQNYLDSIQAREFPEAQTEITQTCITYLLFDSNKHISPYALSLALPGTPSLLRYAVTYALVHARGRPEDDAEDLILIFLAQSSGWLPLWNDTHSTSRQIPTSAGRLCIAAFFNLREIAKYLMAEEAVDDVALYAASVNGHTQMVSILIENGAEVNALGGYYGTALQVATLNGDEAMVRLLISNGADVNIQRPQGNSALCEASRRGYGTIVRLLIDNKAKLNHQTEKHSTALQAASFAGHTEIVRLLLANNADVNIKSIQRPTSTALLRAVAQGFEEIVRILIQHGADVNLETERGTPLQVASNQGNYAMARLLIDEGAQIKTRGKPGGSVLESAMSGGHKEILCLLLEKGTKEDSHRPSLDIQGVVTLDVIDLLLEYGARHGSALPMAARNGHFEVVRLLLEYGADIKAETELTHSNASADAEIYFREDESNDPLHEAARHGHLDVVHFLLENGATTFVPTVHTAIRSGKCELVRFLLKYGEPESGPMLHLAATNGHLEVVRFLLEFGADIMEESFNLPALEAAVYTGARNGHLEIVRLLLDSGQISPNFLHIHGHFPALHQAVSNRHLKIVRLLAEFLGQRGYQPCCISRTWDRYVELLNP